MNTCVICSRSSDLFNLVIPGDEDNGGEKGNNMCKHQSGTVLYDDGKNAIVRCDAGCGQMLLNRTVDGITTNVGTVSTVEPQPEYFADGGNDAWWLHREHLRTGVEMGEILLDEHHAVDDIVEPLLLDNVWYWLTPIVQCG